MGSIERYSKINRKLLSNEFYFQSLMKEAYDQGEISDIEMENIQMQCIRLLSENTKRYNHNDSSSIRIEAAQSIMASNLYTIGIYLKSLPDIPSALYCLKKEPISKLYEQGRRMINTKINVAKHLYQLACKNKIQTLNYTYNATIDDGIKSFFKLYVADFEAHETMASIDYQLMNPVDDLAGVEYIIKYLNNLYLENSFCSKFDTDAIHEVMCGYDKSYKDLLVNIFGQVLQNSLGCAVLNKDILSLNLVDSDIQNLESFLKDKSRESMHNLLQSAAYKVLETLNIESESLESYIMESLPQIISMLYSELNSSAMQTVFVIRSRCAASKVIHYSMGKKMDDKEYRNIVNELIECRYSNDKIQIIKEHIKTLSDIEEIIIDGELSEDEAYTVFDMLDNIEVAVLLKRHQINQGMDAADPSASEIKLQGYLEGYFNRMPEDRRNELQRTIPKLHLT